MKRDHAAAKLPVPGPWQAAVLKAMGDLGQRLGIGLDAIAVTRAEPNPADESALEVWLLAGGKSFRYVSALSGDMAALEAH